MIKIHLYDEWLTDDVGDVLLKKYTAMFHQAREKWGERVKHNSDHTDHFELWLEFATEDDAALFKLTEL
jgi:hypothetical protein